MANITIRERSTSSSTGRHYSVRCFRTNISVVVTSNPASTTPFHPPAATLQLCFGHHCLIYQLAHAPYVPDNFRDFLVSPTVTLARVWCHSDAGRLMASRHRVEMNEPLDLRYILRRANGENLVDGSMKEIVSTFLEFEGVTSDPAIKASNWENQHLSLDQFRQASVDVYVAAAIGVEAKS